MRSRLSDLLMGAAVVALGIAIGDPRVQAAVDADVSTYARFDSVLHAPFESFGSGLATGHGEVSGSIDDGFSYGGALCPTSTTGSDYLCAKSYARAEVLTFPPPTWTTLPTTHAIVMGVLASFELHDSHAALVDVRGDAQITLPGFRCGAGSLATHTLVVDVDLTGTETTYGSDPDLTLTPLTYITPFVACPGGHCGYRIDNVDCTTGSSSLFVRMMLRVALSVPTLAHTGFDAVLVRDYAHTLRINAVDVLDAQDQPMPDVHAFIPDASGAPEFQFLTRAEAALLVNSAVLTVQKAGTGSGSVQSEVPAIDCGSVCARTFPHTDTVTLHANPGPGSSFSGWSGACSGTAACVVGMDQDRAVTATFGGVAQPTPTPTPLACAALASPKLALGKILDPPGDDTLAVSGSIAPATTPRNPDLGGFTIRLDDGGGAVVDVTLPPGAFDKTTKIGWKVNAKRTKWTWTHPALAAPAGVVKAVIAVKKDHVALAVKAAHGDFSASAPLAITLGFPLNGDCATTRFDGTGQGCVVKSKGKTLVCK